MPHIGLFSACSLWNTVFFIKGEIFSIKTSIIFVRWVSQSHDKNRFCSGVRGYWPSQCGRHALRQIRRVDSRSKSSLKKDPVSSWQPSPTTRHFISSGLSRNKLECSRCRETKPRPLWLTLHWLAILFSHECCYNFMHVHFEIDSSLMRMRIKCSCLSNDEQWYFILLIWHSANKEAVF